MSKSDTHEFAYQRLVFNAVAISTLAATAGTTQLWVGLHTADPTDAASTAAEGGYAQYARTATQRSTAGWAITSGTSNAVSSASPSAAISAPQNTSTSTGTFTFATVWMSSAGGPADCLYIGTLSPTINFSQNVTPQITTSSSVTEE